MNTPTQLDNSKQIVQKYLLTLIIIVCSNLVNAQINNCPPNIDFELGNLDNWKFELGQCCPVVTTPTTGAIAGRIDLMTGTGLDPYGKFPVVPSGSGKHTLRLGNSSSGGKAEKAIYKFTVPAQTDNYSLIYKYAVVFEDPSHPASEQPRFEVKIYNAADNTVLPCAEYTYVATASLPGFQPAPGTSSVWFKDWSTASIDLSDYAGETLIAEFTTADCGYGGHFGYAYVDLSCGLFNVNAVLCENDSAIIVNGPAGFDQYLWYNKDYSVLMGTDQQNTISYNSGLDEINLVILPYVGFGCPDTLNTNIILSDFDIKMPRDIKVCDKLPVPLPVQVKGNSSTYSYNWTPTYGLSCSSCPEPILTPAQRQLYNLEVVDQYGCIKKDSIIIEPSRKACCKEMFLPNAFTPNKDGLNDQFNYKTPLDIEIKSWRVYNRWGAQVWTWTGSIAGWDGRYANDPQPTGTYYYVFKYKCLFDDSDYTLSGDINLIR